MTTTRSSIVMLEVRALIGDRSRWPTAPLIGAGANWLTPGAIARMAGSLADNEATANAVRQAVRPVGVLDAVGVLAQHEAYIEVRVEELRALGQGDAAIALQAETMEFHDTESRKAPGQFETLAMARVKAERPPVPPWIDGGTAWTASSVRDRWDMTDEELDELGPVRLDERLDAIELAQRQNEARRRWLQKYEYPLPVTLEEADRLPVGIATSAGAALAWVHAQALAALGRTDLPSKWNAATITRRLFDQYALRNPEEAARLMLSPPKVRLLDPPDGIE